MSQDLADIVPTVAENGEEGMVYHSFQAVSGEAPVGFHVANFSFDGASASEIGDQPGRQAAARAADQHAGFFLGMSLYVKRLEAEKFIGPVSQGEAAVPVLAAQISNLLEGIDWRNPRWTQRPASAG